MLKVRNFSIAYGKTRVVDNVEFHVEPGQIVGIVGESGSGKSTMLRGLIGLLKRSGKIIGGEVLFEGKNLTELSKKSLREIRGNRISMVFQHPELSLDPLWTIGKSYHESVNVHRSISRKESDEEAIQLFTALHLEDARRILERHPFELSGGMCQRVAIAIAIANHPSLILADEPTSALDVTVQKQVIDMMLELRKNFGTSIIMVSHNMGVIAAAADVVGVMQKGKLLEWGVKDQVLYQPQHSYTKELIRAIPKMNSRTDHPAR